MTRTKTYSETRAPHDTHAFFLAMLDANSDWQLFEGFPLNYDQAYPRLFPARYYEDVNTSESSQQPQELCTTAFTESEVIADVIESKVTDEVTLQEFLNSKWCTIEELPFHDPYQEKRAQSSDEPIKRRRTE